MKCKEIRETISAELDGEAPDDQLVDAYHHLADCPDCRRWRRDILAIKSTFAFCAEYPLPQAVEARIARLEQRKTTMNTKGLRSIYRIPRPLAWAAAAVVVLQIGWSSYQLARKPSPMITDEIAETIVLTGRDRTSSTVMVRTNPNAVPKDNQKENGG